MSPLAGQTLLLVEDNPLNQKLLVRFFEGKGYAVEVAGCTQEAEAWLVTGNPSLVLMDVSLPGEDGLTFVRRMREGGGLQMPVVAVTAHAMSGDCDRALEAGCAAYLAKPLDLKVLLDTVTALCASQAVA